jgi:glycogen debranching enzyme
LFDPYYRLGDDYWTSPIWMNINYLIWLSLHKHEATENVELKAKLQAAREELR